MADLIKSLGGKLLQNQAASALPAQPTPQAPVGISQEAARKVLQAGTTQPSGPQQAQTLGIAEATTQQAAAASRGDVANAAQLAAQKQQQEEDAVAAQLSDEALQLKETALGIRQQFAQKQQSILTGLRQGIEKVGLKQRESELQQLGFLMRLNNDKYRARLQAEGRRKRLSTEAAFKEEMMNALFKHQVDSMANSLSFKRMLQANDADFQRKLVTMGTDEAADFWAAELSQTTERGRYKTLGETAKTTGPSIVSTIKDWAKGAFGGNKETGGTQETQTKEKGYNTAKGEGLV